MESKNQLKEIDMKSCSCYYFDDVMRDRGICFDNILLDEKSYEHILIFEISCKNFMGAKALCIRFAEIYGFLKIHDGIIQLVLFDN